MLRPVAGFAANLVLYAGLQVRGQAYDDKHFFIKICRQVRETARQIIRQICRPKLKLDGSPMTPAPAELDGAKAIATAVVDETVRATGCTIHRGPDGVIPQASALAIVESEVSVYLFYCDREWHVLADTWHSSANDAKAQAEFEYAGISKLWKDAV